MLFRSVGGCLAIDFREAGRFRKGLRTYMTDPRGHVVVIERAVVVTLQVKGLARGAAQMVALPDKLFLPAQDFLSPDFR